MLLLILISITISIPDNSMSISEVLVNKCNLAFALSLSSSNFISALYLFLLITEFEF